MVKRNDVNQATIRVTRTIKEEAENYVGDVPKPYLSLSKLNDEALRNRLKELAEQYPEFKKTKESKNK